MKPRSIPAQHLLKMNRPVALVQRLITGYRCETQGCYEMAQWLVTHDETAHHWCARHTRGFMRDKMMWKMNRTNPPERKETAEVLFD